MPVKISVWPAVVHGRAGATKPPGDAMFNQAIEFLKESKTELGKVVFPSRKEVISATTVVILAVIFVSVFLGLVDLGLSNLMSYLVSG
jgi:preprotein translocase subunit SecE